MACLYELTSKSLRVLYALRGRSTYRFYIDHAYRPLVQPRRILMLDIAYIAGLLIAFGVFYGFSYVCSRL